MGQTNFLQSLGWAILNSLWQMALLWVVYQLITSVYKRSTSSFRSVLATTLLMTGFGWFLFTFFHVLLKSGNPAVVASSVFVNPAANESVNDWLRQTLPIASVIYLLLLVFPLMHFIRNYRYVQVIRRFGLSKIDVSWRMFVSKVAAQMSISKKVQIWVSEFVSSPVTIGYLKPIILVPMAAINHLSTQQLEAVLLHELSHIRRHDYLINLIISIIQAVLYFNPFVKGFKKIVEREREKSCDEMVLQFQYNAHEYASALLTLEQANQSQPLTLAASGKKNDLLHRVEKIMGVQPKKVFSFQKLAGLMAGMLCVIALQTVLLVVNETNGKKVASFARVAAGPELGFDLRETNKAIPGVQTTFKPASVREQPVLRAPVEMEPADHAKEFGAAINTDFIQASFDFAKSMELKKEQDEQVQKTLEASKKVLESIQWKLVEKNIADAFTQKEKEALKVTIDKQFNKSVDWKKWENKLKLAYNNIDWEKVNAQLSHAVNEVRLDSIQLVYNIAIDKMDDVRMELKEKDLEGVPDTDITLKDLDTKRAEVRRALNDLKASRIKKIVHL